MNAYEGHTKLILVALVILSVKTSAAHSLHIRSVTSQPISGGLPAVSNTTTTSKPSINVTTAPPPPPNGGAKTVFKPENGSAIGIGSPEVEPPLMVPHVNIVSNDSLPVPKPAPEGKAGFGGPPPVSRGQNLTLTVTGAGESGEEVGVAEEKGRTKNPRMGRYSCRVCPPGYGVARPCSAEEDTVCSRCPSGTFSKGYSATDNCVACSSCTTGFYQRTPCVADSDILCGTCHSHGNGFGNEDFLRKCEDATVDPAIIHEESGDSKSSTSAQRPLPVWPTAAPHIVHVAHKDPETATTEVVLPAIEPHMGEAQAKEKEQDREVKAGGFQWPILLAVLASGCIFFIIGIVTSMLCKKSALRRKRRLADQGAFNDSVRNTSFRRIDNASSISRDSSGYHDSDVRSPLNPGK